MKKIKILHIAFVDDRLDSGISVVVPKHLEHQSKHANVTLLNMYDFTPRNSTGKYNVICVKNIPVLREFLKQKRRPDLVVFHEIYRPYFIKAYKELLREKIPYVIVPHGSLTKKAQLESRRKKQLGNLFFFDKFVKYSSTIQYMSDAERVRSIVGDHPYFVQGSGIDILGRKKEEFSKRGLKVIYVGRLDVQVKGLDILLDAARDNRDLFIENDIRITIAGSDSKGGRHRILNSIKKYDLTDIVNLEGPIYGKKKIAKLLEHDIFAQLSRTEAQCLGLMEAMDIGLPSVVSPGSTFFEIAKRHDVAIPCIGDSHDVAEAFLFAAHNKDSLTDLSRKASLYIAENYSWNKVARLMVVQYQNSISSDI